MINTISKDCARCFIFVVNIVELMTNKDTFLEMVQTGYTFEHDSIYLGNGQIHGEPCPDATVRIPLRTMNRHGLIAGATGTGKTVTLQALAEGLSRANVSSLIMDIKGDLSGIAMSGAPNSKLDKRFSLLGIEPTFQSNPTEFMTISQQLGVPMRATVSEFGPVLMAKILGLNDTQEGVLAMLFKYCDDKKWPLLDLKDLKELLIRASDELKDELQKNFGTFSSTSAGTILRKVIEIEQQGAEHFFGEKSFDVNDFVQSVDGRGVVHAFRIADIQDRPKLFASFMLCLLAEIYREFPEAGDLDRPKLCLFIDEAHLIFEEATDALLKQIETTIKLIRSKGVGIFFITQNPADIPASVLSQLGLKVQHALRAFTARDQKAIKLAAENFPLTEYYNIEDTLISMGIGEALVTALNEKGIPTPLVHTILCPPMSRIGVLDEAELKAKVDASSLYTKYNERIDRDSAYEILTGKLKDAEQEVEKEVPAQEGPSVLEKVGDAINSPVGKIIVREVTRGLLGVLGFGPRRRR